MTNKKVIITGNLGFIGSWATVFFHMNNFQVYGLDNRSSYGKRLFDNAGLEKLVNEQMNCDVSDLENWSNWAIDINPDIIIHLAGQAIVPRAFKQPILTFKSNALGTLAVLEVAKYIQNLKSILCITSDKVYENNGIEKPFVETDNLGGSDIYSISKTCCEFLSNIYVKTHLLNKDINIQTIRLGNVVGGGDWSVNRLIPDLINSIENNIEFKIRYFDATRPFQHVSDVVKGIFNVSIASLENAIESGNAWNLGPKNNTFASVRDVVNLFKTEYPNIKIINQENGGPANARNNGIKNSNGVYILPLDSDDMISSDYIQTCVNIIKKDNNRLRNAIYKLISVSVHKQFIDLR
jgi:CDP-glucose 4,6-dehydratase